MMTFWGKFFTLAPIFPKFEVILTQAKPTFGLVGGTLQIRKGPSTWKCNLRLQSQTDLVEKCNATIEHHVAWLKTIGMVCNLDKSEAMSFYMTPWLDQVGPPENIIKIGSSMNILGLTFDNKLNWGDQVTRTIAKAKRVLYGLKSIRRYLSDREFRQVLTSHFYPVLMYGSEIWYSCSSYRDRARIESIHYRALRIMFGDWKNAISRVSLNRLAQRATPSEWAKYAVVKLAATVTQTTFPTRLFNSITPNSYKKNRSPGRLFFFSDSKKRIGEQALRNRLGPEMNALCFPWINCSPDTMRINLKQHFFAYLK